MKIIQSLLVSWRSSKIRKWYKKEFNILQGLIVSWERNEYVNNYLKKIYLVCVLENLFHTNTEIVYMSQYGEVISISLWKIWKLWKWCLKSFCQI